MGPWPRQEPTAVNTAVNLEQHDAASGPRRRPGRVTAAAVVLIIRGMVAALTIGVVLQSSSQPLADADTTIRLAVGWGVFMAVVQVASGVFVWNGRSWARGLVFVVLGIDIGLGLLLAVFTGAFAAACGGTAVDSLIIWLLASYDVADWCRRHRPQPLTYER